MPLATQPVYQAAAELFEQHRDWCCRVATRLRRRFVNPPPPDEVQSAALEGLWRAARTYDGVRPFQPYARRRIAGSILDYLRSLQPAGQRRAKGRPFARCWQLSALRLKTRLEVEPVTNPAEEGPLLSAIIADSIEQAIRSLRPIEQEVVRLHCCQGSTQSAIGRQLGLTQSRVSTILTESLDYLRQLHANRGG